MAWKAVKWVYPENGKYYTTGDLMCGDKMVGPNDEKAPDSVITMVGDHGDECIVMNFYRPELLRMDSCGLL